MADEQDKTPAGETNGASQSSVVPWEEGKVFFIKAFFRNIRAFLVTPRTFFLDVGSSDNRWPALSFAVLVHILGFSLAALWEFILGDPEFKIALIRVIIAPLWVLASVWLGSEMMHGWLRLFRARSDPTEELPRGEAEIGDGPYRRPEPPSSPQELNRGVTHRVVAYCYTTALLGVIPRIPLSDEAAISGLAIGLVVAFFYQVIGLSYAHRCSMVRSFLAVFATWFVLLGTLILLAQISASQTQVG